MEQLTSEQLENYVYAVDVAYLANEAFDGRQHSAVSISELTPQIVDEDVDEDELVADFNHFDNKFETFQKAASLLMPPRSAFEVAEPAESFVSETVWALMSKEQKVKADSLRTAIAEQLAEHGVTADSLRVVMHQTPEGENKFTLLHAGNGINIGDTEIYYDVNRSYKHVMGDKNKVLFTVTVDGQKYDTRKGMTDTAYDALYEDAKSRGTTLPDSKQMAEENDDIGTWTMLTGEPITVDGDVQVRRVGNGVVCMGIRSTDVDDRGLRVRPAVEI